MKKISRSSRRAAQNQRRRLLVESLEDRRLLAGLPIQIEDLNQITGSGVSRVDLSAELNGEMFFFATQGNLGEELWKTDGTETGTVLVKDINPGIVGSTGNSTSIVTVGDAVYFSADDGTHGRELWRSDGTAAGTVMVKDTLPGTSGGGASNIAELNGALVFSTSDGGFWRSDGTDQGTELIQSFAWSPYQTTTVGNKTFFVAPVGPPNSGDTALWVTNGTTAGTEILKNINPGDGDDLDALVAVGNKLYFSANDGVNGSELWTSDGTVAGTQMLKNIGPGQNDGVNAFGYRPNITDGGDGFVYFNANDGVVGWELWRTDGTEVGTSLVKDIQPGPGSSQPNYYANLIATSQGIFFWANDGTNGFEIWTTNGTTAGTNLLADINPGPNGSDQNTFRMRSANDQVYFFAHDGSSRQLWTSDGTVGGTQAVTASLQALGNDTGNIIGPLGDNMLFSGHDELHGAELWTSDGTVPGTSLVKDINTFSGGSQPRNFTQLGDQTLFFAADGISDGWGLWATDGSVGGAMLLTDSTAGSGPLTVMNGMAYFRGFDAVHGNELWATDGTSANTRLVADINPGAGSAWAGSSHFEGATVLNNQLVFSARDDINGVELWTSDGTAAGTQLLSDINPGSQSSSPVGFTQFGNQLIFTARDDTHGHELWKTDGTPSGTVLIKDIRPGANQAFLSANGDRNHLFTAAGAEVFFMANDGVAGLELWKSDGKTLGTEMVKDINPGPGSVAPSTQKMHEFDGKLYFAGDDGSKGVELWSSDGTESGTVLVKDINPGSGNSLADYYYTNYSDHVFFDATTLGNEFYFVARDGTHGNEVWKSDGTEAGTMLVKDITPGGGDSFSYDDNNLFYQDRSLFVESAGVLYFTPREPIAGLELWGTDGSEARTELVADIDPRVFSGYAVGSLPRFLTDIDGSLFFNARSPQDGDELWKIVGNEPPTVSLTGSATVDEGAVYMLNLTTSDSDNDLITTNVDWGDGTIETVQTNQLPGSFGASHIYADNGPYPITVTVTDEDGGQSSSVLVLVVNNVDPVISMVTSRLIVNEGTSAERPITVTDVAADVVSISASFGALSSTGADSWLWSYDATDDLGRTVVVITATDGDGGSAESSFEFLVDNVAPVANISGPNNGVTGQNRKFTLEASDPSIVDREAGFTFEIDWEGDRNFDETIVALSGTQLTHSYLAAGTYTVYLKATDKDGETSQATTSIVIATSRMQGNNLIVGGTAADDTIQFEVGPNPEDVEVFLNGVSQGVYQPTGELRAFGEDGNDTLTVDAAITLPSYLRGDAGNDILRGGAGPDRLLGGDGDDQLFGRGGDDLLKGNQGADTLSGGADNDELLGGGGADTISGGGGDDILRGGGDADVLNGNSGADILIGQGGGDTLDGGGGRDIVIGGKGKDQLAGGGGSDILIGGSTIFDNDNTALLALMAEWNSSNSYVDRVANLRDGSGAVAGANGGFYLSPGTTVIDDGKQDTLAGDGGRDWLFASLADDLLSDLEANELVDYM